MAYIRVSGVTESEAEAFVRQGEDKLRVLRGLRGSSHQRTFYYPLDDKDIMLIVKRQDTHEFITIIGTCKGGYVEYGALSIGAVHLKSPSAVSAGSYQTGDCAPLPDWFPLVKKALAGTHTSKVYGFPEPPTPLPVTPPPNTNGLNPEAAECLLFPDHCELTQKKNNARLCNPSMSTGKMKLLFQSLLGSNPLNLAMINEGVYTYRTGAGEIPLKYSNVLFRDAHGTYWIVDEAMGTAICTRLVFSECGQEIINRIMQGKINATDSTGYPREMEAQLEAYLFTFLTVPHPKYPNPHPTTGEVYTYAITCNGGALGAGQWHGAYQKNEAIRVVQVGAWGAELQQMDMTTGTMQAQVGNEPVYPPPPAFTLSVISSGEATEEYKQDWRWAPVGGSFGQYQVGGTQDKTYNPVSGTKPVACFYDFNDDPVVAYFIRSGEDAGPVVEHELQPYCAAWGYFKEVTKTSGGVYTAGYFIVSAAGSVSCIHTAATSMNEMYEEYHHSGNTVPAYTTETSGYLDPGNTVSITASNTCGESEDAKFVVVGPAAYTLSHEYGGMWAIAGETRLGNGGGKRRKGLFMKPFDTVDGFYIAGLQEEYASYVLQKTVNNTAGHIFYRSTLNGVTGFWWGWDVGFQSIVSSEDRERASYTYEAYVATPEGVFECDSGGDSYEGPIAYPPPDSYTNPKQVWAQQLFTTDGMFPQVKYAISSGVVTMSEYTKVSGQDRIRSGGHTAGDIFIGWA